MSTTVFDFNIVADWEYGGMHPVTSVVLNDPVEVVRPDGGAYGRYAAEFDVYVPGAGIATGATKTISDWNVFVRAMQGPYDFFLFKDPFVTDFYKVENTDDDGDLGNGDATETTFALVHNHIDTSTLQVWVDGSLQTLTTHYTLEDNDDGPSIEFVSPPGNGLAVTVAYEFYMPCKFAADPGIGKWQKSTLQFRTSVSIQERYAGAHRV